MFPIYYLFCLCVVCSTISGVIILINNSLRNTANHNLKFSINHSHKMIGLSLNHLHHIGNSSKRQLSDKPIIHVRIINWIVLMMWLVMKKSNLFVLYPYFTNSWSTLWPHIFTRGYNLNYCGIPFSSSQERSQNYIKGALNSAGLSSVETQFHYLPSVSYINAPTGYACVYYCWKLNSLLSLKPVWSPRVLG